MADTLFFTPGNLVVAVSGCGAHAGTCTSVKNGTGDGTGNSSVGGYGDNQASPLTLFQYQPTGTASVLFVNSLVLPQNSSGVNLPVSAEYGSASEGTLQLSGIGHYLAIMGYGINADTFNGNHDAYSPAPNAALAQSGSLTGQSYTPIARTLALIDQNGNVNSSTGLFNIFNGNNPRSVFTADGANIYVSGQGTSPDSTGGVFLTTLGSSTSTAITGNDTNSKTSAQDTRDVQIFNNTLYASVDGKEGSGSNRDFIGTLGTPPATSLFNNSKGPTQLTGFGNNGGTGKLTITAANTNGVNSPGTEVNISPVSFFFANANTLYVADGGQPKNDSVTNDTGTPTPSLLGNGGLQKWVLSGGTWSLKYTLGHQNGLNLVGNHTAIPANTSGMTGLYGLTGKVVGANVLLYATSSNISDMDVSYLFGITDVLAATTNPGASESFTILDTAPADSNFRGVSFAPATPAGGVTITSSPSGLAFNSANAGCAPGSYTTPVTLLWTPGSTCQLSLSATQDVTASQEFTFNSWEDTTVNPIRTVVAPAAPTTYSAKFDTNYFLTTSAGTGGTVSPGGFFPAGSNAVITATPSAGFYFVNFTGSTTSTSNPLSLLMDGAKSIQANFAQQITPVITWPAPAPITFGSALSSVQLNATTTVPGTFTYTPPAGTVLPVGPNQPLSVTFTPNDTTVYLPAAANNTITVNPVQSGPANLVVTKTLTRVGGNVVVQVTVANTGGSAAASVILTVAKVGSVSGAPLPQNLGTIAAGGSASATVTVPGSVGAPGATTSLVLSGTYTGGTFSSSARIVLP
jgi:Divergent InlB B-repeat domain